MIQFSNMTTMSDIMKETPQVRKADAWEEPPWRWEKKKSRHNTIA